MKATKNAFMPFFGERHTCTRKKRKRIHLTEKENNKHNKDNGIRIK